MAAAAAAAAVQRSYSNIILQIPTTTSACSRRLTRRIVLVPWKQITMTKPTLPIAAVVQVSSPDVVTYTSSISTDIPLYEPPGVSFDEYLRDRPRVFRAMFSDQSRSHRLNDEEWRIQMLPLQFMLLTVDPVVVLRLRCRPNEQESPPAIPGDTTTILELEATKWELRGLDGMYKPSHFDLAVHGSLYTDRRSGDCGHRSRLKGHLEISISCIMPPALAIVPDNILRGVAESVLKTVAERMKRDVDVGLIKDFQKFRREKIMQHVAEISAGVVNARGDF